MNFVKLITLITDFYYLNISGALHNFNKASSTSTSTYNVPYDIGSLLHYSSTAFSQNEQKTIRALVRKPRKI